MKRLSFLLKFLLALTVLLLVVQTLLLVFFTQRIRQDLEEANLSNLRTSAQLLKEWARPELTGLFEGQSKGVLARVSNRAGYRISLFDAKGTLLEDSHLTPGVFQDSASQADLDQATVTGESWSTSFSQVMGKVMMTYVIPFHDGGPVLGFIRLSTPVESLNKTLESLFILFLVVSFGAQTVVFVLAWLYSRDFSASMTALIQNAGAFARGEAYTSLYVNRPRELRLLSLALNKLYNQLDDRITTVNTQRDELAAILEGMVEGVLVLDSQLHIKTMNSAARHFFAEAESPIGTSLIEATRHSGLDEFAQKVHGGNSHGQRTEIVLRDHETTLQVQGAPLQSDDGKLWGSVLVMIDITTLKRLEAMRRDFVSNVSHELKTPITNVLGYVETLADGAIDDPALARKFLDTIQRHASRLNMIVDDLLILTRLENSPPQEGERRPVDLSDLVPGAVRLVEQKAQARRVTLMVRTPSGPLSTQAYPLLLEQALVNLVDNAVKFSPEGGAVEVTVGREGTSAVLTVTDAGPGIPAAEQGRVFERFYRTEKGRSTPGTGLGLSIVKHILVLHRGTVQINSPVPGQSSGSRFTLRFPLNETNSEPSTNGKLLPSPEATPPPRNLRASLAPKNR